MNKEYVTHWIIGIASLAIWAYGDKAGIPTELVKYAAVVLPTVVGHALAFTPGDSSPNVQAPSGAESVDHQPV